MKGFGEEKEGREAYLTSSGNADEQAKTRACQGQMRRSVYTVTVSASRWKVCSSARILLLLIDKYDFCNETVFTVIGDFPIALALEQLWPHRFVLYTLTVATWLRRKTFLEFLSIKRLTLGVSLHARRCPRMTIDWRARILTCGAATLRQPLSPPSNYLATI